MKRLALALAVVALGACQKADQPPAQQAPAAAKGGCHPSSGRARSSTYGFSPVIKDAAARASRGDVQRVIASRASGAGTGMVRSREPNAAAHAAKNSRCVRSGAASLVTL